MYKKLLTIALLSLSAATAFAQGAAFPMAPATRPNYELADQFSAKKIDNMVYSTAVTPNFFKDSDKFWYSWKTSQGTNYYIVDPVAKTKTEIFDLDRLAMEVTLITKDPFEAKHLPIRKLKLKDDKTFTFEIKAALADSTFHFEYDIATKALRSVPDSLLEKEYPRWASISPDGKIAVFAKNHNLWWMEMSELEKLRKDPKDSTVVDHQLSFDGIPEFDYGGNSYTGSYVKDTTARTPAFVYWSPDSKHFATFKYDMRPVKELWVINSVKKGRPELETYKYQMPGEPGPVEELHIFNMEDKSDKKVNVSAFKDQTLSIVTPMRKNSDTYNKYRKDIWKGDNNSFYLYRISRDLKRVDLCVADVNVDTLRNVVEERLNTYIEYSDPLFFNSDKEFAFWSERNGWANIYVFGNDGTLKYNVNNAPYHVSDILYVNEADKSVIFTANGVDPEENPYYAHIYKCSLKEGAAPVRIDQGNYHAYSVYTSDNGKYLVSNFSRVDCTPRSALFDNTGRKVMDLEEADFSQLFAAGYKFPEQFKVKAADGITDLWGVMYKPFDFDSTKTYPIIDYVYPGPQVEGNNIQWVRGMTRVDRLAQIGFIVITVGNRGGHPDRSKWYHNYGYGNLRDYGLEDQKYAIQQLASRHNFIDINRVGIHGHSGGGFMSTAAILTYPDFFKVAVSCAGNHDNSMYNRWWSEQHHGIKEKVNASGDTTFVYAIEKNQDLAKNLKGHLMLVHGDIDNNVHPGNTIRVVNALIRANKRFDMLILPGQRHGFGDMNEYFFWRMADYYSEWLLGGSKRCEVDIRELNND